ncbi:ABC transporter permease [Exiguobacterium sp. Leaf196]|uniref:ABC transporter permease n=1 Tax=Exiguobacterium sp. Leaf196 TaxID=1736298 RepID=UPI0006FA51B4|nr:ABC transporter permease [Exiguobacterium sp. Leaf196]KQS44586.1 ABC transporter [Exiguobacterium sp. Leaf196]
MNSQSLWKERYQAAMTETVKYTRYMANGGLLFTVYFVILYALVVYGRFLDQLDPSFPGRFVMAALFLILPLYRTSRTFLVEADQVFLLPVLAKLSSFMQQVRAYNAIFGIIRAVIPFLAVVVLYVRTEQTTPFELILIGVSLALFGAAANLSKLEGIAHRTVLLYAFGAALLVIIDMAWMSIVVALLLMIVLHLKRQDHLPLREWIALERESRDRFYRLANWFVDVPHLSATYKHRRLLSNMVERFPYQAQTTFDYLYVKQFIRSGDGIGLIVRLTLIGAVFMLLASGNVWFVALAIPAFGGLTSFQLAPFTKAVDQHLLTRLLPFGNAVHAKQKIIRFAAISQCIVLTLLGFFLSGSMYVVGGAAIALVIGEYYARK